MEKREFPMVISISHNIDNDLIKIIFYSIENLQIQKYKVGKIFQKNFLI